MTEQLTGRPGAERSPGPSVQDYLDRDSRPVPEVLRYDRSDFLGDADIPIDRFLSPEWARAEMERVWRRVWQFACREEDIPEVGDHEIYEIGTDSLIVVRTGPDEIRAYVNACLHRGRKLRTHAGNVPALRCPFHGFTWNLDGTLKSLPCAWDFPHVDPEKFALPEARVDTWRGFVFVNMDPYAEPLAEFLGDFGEHYIWPLQDRYKSLHVAKVLPCNWKVAQDAFLESFHVISTHPQLLPWLADANSQYDTAADQPHWSRMINVQGAPSPHVADSVSEQEVLESFYTCRSFYAQNTGRDLALPEGEQLPQVPEGGTARQVLADRMRTQLAETTGADHTQTSDAELLDAMHHLVFPNFHPWGGVKSNIIYRFRPVGLDPESCTVEVLYLSQPPPGKPRPAPAKIRMLEPDELFADVPGLGLIGPIFDQDAENLPYVQEGLRTTRKPGITLSNYQESRIRHFNHTLDEWMSR